MIQLTDSQEGTFWAHCRMVVNCWVWTGPVDSQGYAVYYFGGQAYHAAHVAYWLRMRREAEHGAYLVCGYRLCCNPQHLGVGSCLP